MDALVGKTIVLPILRSRKLNMSNKGIFTVDVGAVMAIIDKWMVSYDHIGTGSSRSGQISEREWEEDRAKLLELLAATPAHDPPEGG